MPVTVIVACHGFWQTDWCVRPSFPGYGMEADFERSWKESLTIKISRIALFTALMH